MGFASADIELINGDHISLARKAYINEKEIKRVNVSAIVDSNFPMLAITKKIQAQLQLEVLEKRSIRLKNDEWIECDALTHVEVKFKNRQTTCSAVILSGNSEIIVGMIPLMAMDVLIDPLSQKLIVNPAHPDCAHTRL